MLLRIDFRSGKPAYLQIVDQIKSAGAAGTLRPGEQLPSMGGLSRELRVNRNAVSKAYEELEGAGLIELRVGGDYFLKERGHETRKETQRTEPALQTDEIPAPGPAALERALRYWLLATLMGAISIGLGVQGAGTVPILLVAAALALPLRSLSGKAAHRIVFAKRWEFPRVLRALKAEAPSQPDLSAFMERVAERSERALGARVELIQERAAVASLVQTNPGLGRARAPIAAGADLLMPVIPDEEVRGILRLGPKASGREFAPEDLKFLAALAEQVGITANQFRMRQERHESAYAREIQQGLLPREIPQIAGFSIAASWQPARNVGGDYYDVFPVEEEKLALVIADVSGKGLPAALLMSNLQATVKAYASVEASPKKLCERVNRAVCKSIAPDRFITFFYAVLDAGERRMSYTNAGHNPPLLVRQDGACRRLEGKGGVLGVFPEECYDQGTIELLPGDRLVLFTDGITEAADTNGTEHGEQRLISRIKESAAQTAGELRDEIMLSVGKYCRGEFADDATLLIVAGDRAIR